MKRCSKCGIKKERGEFSKARQELDGLQYHCKDCNAESYYLRKVKNPAKMRKQQRRWRKLNPRTPAQSYKMALKSKYGLSVEDFNALLDKQDNRCVICSEKFTSTKHRHVDHCHTTKKVRGLLCQFCNTGLGNFRDSPDRLRAAANYLEKS